MRNLRFVPVATALASAAVFAFGAEPAFADTTVPAPEIGTLAAVAVVNVDGPGTAWVTGRYRCWGPSDEMHVWVSVKQGGPDPTAEGSSSTVDAWYDTNVSQDVAVVCDGHWRVKTVALGMHPTDFTGRQLQALTRGAPAWLQFCMVPATSTEDNFIFASQSRWVQVAGKA
jgi:hypothetical protein